MFHRFTMLLSVALMGFLCPEIVGAQAPEGTLTLPSSVTVNDAGWGQITNTDELIEFLLAVVETLVFVSAFAFHPRGNALRQDSQGWMVQVSIFLFGLIGMFVGFLVIHHGYLIGFVVFGLGSLFRFRMPPSSMVDGAILIMVTLVGLAVGLNLPVMALVATVAGCVTLWLVAARKTSVIELKFRDEEALRAALEPVERAFKSRGIRIASIRKSDFKPVVEFVLSHDETEVLEKLPVVLEELKQAGHGAKGWHVA